ncbi:MAG: hypothetical protein MUP73_06470 [Dehalococcoidia bacterium]|nr:hypothetical protein [Dehalococcoidia bacterium]
MGGGGPNSGGGVVPQSLDYVRDAGLAVPAVDAAYNYAPVGAAYNYAANSNTLINPALRTLFGSLGGVEAAGLPTGTTGDIPGYAKGGKPTKQQMNVNGSLIDWDARTGPETQRGVGEVMSPNSNFNKAPRSYLQDDVTTLTNPRNLYSGAGSDVPKTIPAVSDGVIRGMMGTSLKGIYHEPIREETRGSPGVGIPMVFDGDPITTIHENTHANQDRNVHKNAPTNAYVQQTRDSRRAHTEKLLREHPEIQRLIKEGHNVGDASEVEAYIRAYEAQQSDPRYLQKFLDGANPEDVGNGDNSYYDYLSNVEAGPYMINQVDSADVGTRAYEGMSQAGQDFNAMIKARIGRALGHEPRGYAAGGALGQGNSNGAPLQFGQQFNPAPQFNTQSAYNNYAVPNQNLMDYPQQGQPNQPYAATLPVPSNPSPDMGGMSASNNMGFDNSGSDAGVGGQPVAQKQTPLQGQAFGQPPSLSQYMPQQGLQIQGNPTAMPVQYTQQR